MRLNPSAFASQEVSDGFNDAQKQDDLADSLLMVLYYLDTYSNQLSTTDVFVES